MHHPPRDFIFVFMAKARTRADDFDSPWKEALQVYFRPFLEFFFADIAADINWAKPYEALDKEFQQITRKAKIGKRLADKLFKVFLQNGGERWLLIHIEIQGDYEAGFAERMFNYNSAVRQMYNQTVVSLAVLADERRDWRPHSFSYGQWGCKMELTFRLAKLLDFEDVDPASSNPFATIVAAHGQAQRTRHNPASRRQAKLALVKGLYRSNWSKEDILQLFRLIDWLMALPEDLEEGFYTEIHNFALELNMPFVTSFERIQIKHAHQQGLEEGREQGRMEELLESIDFTLKERFGKSASQLMPGVKALGTLAKIRLFHRYLLNAKDKASVEAYLKRTSQSK